MPVGVENARSGGCAIAARAPGRASRASSAASPRRAARRAASRRASNASWLARAGRASIPSARSRQLRGTAPTSAGRVVGAEQHAARSARCAGAARARRRPPAYSSSATWKLLPPKPKPTDRRRGAGASRVADPRARARCSGRTGCVSISSFGFGRVDLDRRRQHLVVQRHHRLEQAGRAGRGLGVADLRLHRAERAPLRGRARPDSSNTGRRPSNSAASPALVPVPCASTSSTVSGP